MHIPDIQTLLFLFFAALIAGCFDAIAGGGGLLTVPSLLIAGFDPLTAIATNKLQGVFGCASSTFSFSRHGLIDWKDKSLWLIVSCCFLASIVGASFASFVSKALLNAVVPVLLIAVAIYFLISKKMTDMDADGKMSVRVFAFTIAPLVGFYDGIFGPGGGAFYMVGFVSMLGFGVKKATANTKLANLASNLGGLLLYAATDSIVWVVGFVMALGAFIGARLGVILAMRLGARLIKPLLVVISCGMAVRLLMNPQNPVNQIFMKLIS